MSPLGVGVIGLGVGAAHAEAFAKLEHTEVVALCDLDRGRLEKASATYPTARLFDDAEALISDPLVEIVSIASYDDAHAGQAALALSERKHTFVEKPLCRSAAEVRQLHDAWETGGRPALAANLVLRAAPLYGWLRGRVASGEFGRVYAFDGDYLYGRLEKITQGWRNDVSDYSVMAGGGIHLVDLMLWVTGEVPRRVWAAGNRISSEGTAFRYLDYVTATFEFESGLVGRITANFGCVHPHHHVVRAFGTQATFIHDDAGARLRLTRDPEAPAQAVDLDPLPVSKGVLIPSFVDSVLSGTARVSEVLHEFAVVSVCIAADEALRTGEPTEINYA